MLRLKRRARENMDIVEINTYSGGFETVSRHLTKSNCEVLEMLEYLATI